MGFAGFQQIGRHLFVDGLFHVGEETILLPERKAAGFVGAVEVFHALIHRLAAEWAVANTDPRIKPLAFRFRDGVASFQHLCHQFADVLQESVRRHFPALHTKKPVLPFSGQRRRFQIVRDHGDHLHAIFSGNDLFAFPGCVAGMYQLFDDVGPRSRRTQTLLLGVGVKLFVAGCLHSREQSIFGVCLGRRGEVPALTGLYRCKFHTLGQRSGNFRVLFIFPYLIIIGTERILDGLIPRLQHNLAFGLKRSFRTQHFDIRLLIDAVG